MKTYTVKELADLFRCSESTVRRILEKEKTPVKQSGIMEVYEDDAEKLKNKYNVKEK